MTNILDRANLLPTATRNFVFALLGITLLTIWIRLPSLVYSQVINNNEAVYSLVANEIIDGGLPYIDAVERKPPLLFWVYSAIFKVAGKYNWKALRVVSLVWTLATMAGLYVIGRDLFDRNTGLIAALLYSVFQPWETWQNLTFNGELMMNLPLVWAYAIAFRESLSRIRPHLVLAGALLGTGFLLKQPAAISAVPLGVYLLLPSYRTSRGYSRSETIVQASMLTVGFFAALGVVAIVLWKQGILGEAYRWTIKDHSIPLAFWKVFWILGVGHTLEFIGSCLPLLIGAALAFPDRRAVWANRSAERSALLGLLAVSAIGVLSGGRFNHHYYIQLIPALALLAAPHFAQLLFANAQRRYWTSRVIYSYLALTVIGFSISHWRRFVELREPSETTRYLLEHSTPGDRIFVWGSGKAARIYTGARRRPACRYIDAFPLSGHVFGGPIPGFDTRKLILPDAWSNLQQDFAKHPPIYIIDFPDLLLPHPIQNFPILAELLAEKYQPVARTRETVIYRAYVNP